MDGPDLPQATEALAAAAGFQQAASVRAAGLTWMLWGLAFPLAAAALSTGGEFSADLDRRVHFSFQPGWGAWAPVLVLAWAAVVTGFIWHAFAVKPETRLRPAVSLAVSGVLLPILVSVAWFLGFLFWVVRPDRSPDAHWAAAERAFVFLPSPLIVAGVWMLAASFGPWLGPRRALTRWAGAGTVAAGLLLNALRLVDVAPGSAVRSGSVLVVMGAIGTYLYVRG